MTMEQSKQEGVEISNVRNIEHELLEKKLHELKDEVKEQLTKFVATIDPDLYVTVTVNSFETKMIDEESQMRVLLFKNGQAVNCACRIFEPLDEGVDKIYALASKEIARWHELEGKNGDVREKMAA